MSHLYQPLIKKSCGALLLVLMCISCSTRAQSTYTTGKTTTKKAQELFLEGKKLSSVNKLEDAIKKYDKALAQDPQLIDAKLYKAGALRALGKATEAASLFTAIAAIDSAYEPRVFTNLGEIAMENKSYLEAVNHFQRYLWQKKVTPELVAKSEKQIKNALLRQQAMQQPVPFEPTPFGSGINTPENGEYLPCFSADGKTLIFTRNKLGRDEDFYYSSWVDGQWQEPIPLATVNTLENEGAQSISADASVLVYTYCESKPIKGLGGCDLYISTWDGVAFSKGKNLGPNINSGAWESLPSLSANGDLLYFSSNRTGGVGGSDIYVSKRNGDGSWSKAEILKGAINTSSNDQAPFIHPDGKTLYFMSNGHPGFGGMDVFYARKETDGTWGTPVNIGYPINTEKNEGAFYVSMDGTTAFFSKERADKSFAKFELGSNAYHSALDIFSFELYAAARPAPVTYVKARVLDAVTKKPLQTNATILTLKDGKIFTQKTTGKEGSFLIVLPSGDDYALSVQKEGYLFHSENFSLNGIHQIDQPFELTILLQPITGINADKQKPVVLKNVFFDTGSALLRKESYSELDLLVELLQKNAALKIELRGHTDNVGADNDNLKLSENRAKAVVEYLALKGIDRQRLRAKGFGETQPVDSNDTEAGRQNNRRTEFIPF